MRQRANARDGVAHARLATPHVISWSRVRASGATCATHAAAHRANRTRRRAPPIARPPSQAFASRTPKPPPSAKPQQPEHAVRNYPHVHRPTPALLHAALRCNAAATPASPHRAAACAAVSAPRDGGRRTGARGSTTRVLSAARGAAASARLSAAGAGRGVAVAAAGARRARERRGGVGAAGEGIRRGSRRRTRGRQGRSGGGGCCRGVRARSAARRGGGGARSRAWCHRRSWRAQCSATAGCGLVDSAGRARWRATGCAGASGRR